MRQRTNGDAFQINYLAFGKSIMQGKMGIVSVLPLNGRRMAVCSEQVWPLKLSALSTLMLFFAVTCFNLFLFRVVGWLVWCR